MITEYLKTQNTKGVLEMIQEKDTATLKSMYPDIPAEEFQNKYKLFLYFDYYCKWINFSNICANVQIKTKDNQEFTLPQYKLRHPYPNKCYSHIAMRNGRRVSRRGLPLLFDTYEELSKISEINVTWTTKFKRFSDDLSYVLLISYNINDFVYKENNTFYGIYNKDFDPYSVVHLEKEQKILDEYNIGIHFLGDDLIYASNTDVPEDEEAKALLEKYTHIIKILSECNIPVNNDTMIDMFCSDIVLEPFTETRMIPAFY